MSIKQKKNGTISNFKINASDIQLLDVNDNFTSTSVEGAFKETSNKIGVLNTQLSEMTHQKWDYVIKTTDNPQVIIDSAPAGSKITFEGGVHEHGLSRNNAMINIEKALTLNIPETATLKVANGSMNVNKNAELITNFHANNPIQNLLINSEGYSLGNTIRTYEIVIDNITTTPNTFKYQIRDFNNNVVADWVTGNVITGDYQVLADGISIKFPQTIGYTLNAGCIVAVGSYGYYAIRIGTGIHENYIDGVEITGEGVINQNQTNNAYSNLYALWLNCGLLINGRVKNFRLEDKIKFRDCNRTIVILGENVGGTKNLDGTVTGGTNYNVDTVSIKHTIADEGNISGVLFGMPEHRGIINNLTFDENEIHCSLTGIEPNNLLQNYSVQNNKIYSAYSFPIHCWRASKNGVVKSNLIYDGNGECTISSPAGWASASNITMTDNINVNNLKNLYSRITSGLNNVLNGNYSNISGGASNSLTGTKSTINGGAINILSGDTSNIGGGLNNAVNGTSSVIGGGQNHIITGDYNTTSGGATNTTTGTKNVIGGGALNNIASDYNVIDGGVSNTITGGGYNSINGGLSNQIINNVNFANVSGVFNIAQHSNSRVGGKQGKTKFAFSDVFSGGNFTTQGDAQISRVIQRCVTSDATPIALTFDGATVAYSNSLVLPTNATWGYKITVLARDSSGANRGMWEANGMISRVNSAPVLEGGSVTKIFATNASWNAEIIASTTYNNLAIRVTGVASTTIRWVAKIELVEVEF